MYISKQEAEAEEIRAKEQEMIRLGVISAKIDPDNSERNDEEENDNDNPPCDNVDSVSIITIPSKSTLKAKVKLAAIYEYRALLWQCQQQTEVAPILQMWYDILELREGRYRLKPLRLLRIATCQNNIAMLLIENYLHYRKSASSQRRMTEANSLLSFLVDTVSERSSFI